MINYTFDVSDLEYFLLILMRISTFIAVAPLYGRRGIPRQVKIGLSFFIAVLLYGTLPNRPVLEYNTVWGYGVIIVKEALTGIIIGFSANICTTILGFAGRIVDMETGMSMANLMDPATGENETISGVLYQYVIMLMLMISGMFEYILYALTETFELIPINGAIFSSEKLLSSIIVFLNDYVSIGFRICLPVFAVMLLLNAVLGIMAKVSPQLNMFAVGMQLKVLVGLSTLFLTAGMLPLVSNMISGEMKKMMAAFVEAMM